MEADVLRFTPTNSGTINRQFSDVKPKWTIYCYQQHNKIGKIILRLVCEDELPIEHQRGICESRNTFNEPNTYHR